MPHTEAVGNTSPRRLKRRSSDVVAQDENVKKQRGRPRLEPLDETAQDRRRTQIRLAQRSYRQRKETTIIALRKRTSELKYIITQMRAEILAYADNDFNSDLQNPATIELRGVLRSVDKLVDDAKLGTDEISDDYGMEKLPKENESESPTTSPSVYDDVPKPAVVHVEPRIEELVPVSTEYGATVSIGMGYDMIWEPEEVPNLFDDVSASPISLNIPTPSSSDYVHSQDEESKDDSFTSASSTSPEAVLMSSKALVALKPPYSFCGNETSFSRRLHRATLEKGIHLIQNQMIAPDIFRRKFQMCLPYGSVTHMTQKIISILARPVDDSLEWEDHPVTHLGGAGTHYAKQFAGKDKSGYSVSNFGLQALVDVMNATEEFDTSGRPLDITGFEGEWFDAEDVEGYLEQKGIRIEPGQRFTDLTLEVKPQKPIRYSQPNLIMDRAVKTGHDLDFFDFDAGLRESSISNALPKSSSQYCQTAQMFDRDSGDMLPPNPCLSSREFVDKKQSITINVEKFVLELVKRATCIGRTPGYRQRDIDRAFNLSVAAH